MTHLEDIQRRALADSKAWFPDVHRSDHHAVVHFALGIAGEVGELVNLVKKVNRGSTTFADEMVKIQHEAADVLIYLMDIAETLGIDLAAAVEAKRAILIERWGNP